MTDEELQEIEERANAATEGPWLSGLAIGVPRGEVAHAS